MVDEVRFRAQVQTIGRVAIPAKLRRAYDWIHEGGTVEVTVRPIEKDFEEGIRKDRNG